MNSSFEVLAMIQGERERYIRRDRLARLAAAVRACCSPSRIERITRVFRNTPATS